MVDDLQNALSVITAGENNIGRVESEGRAGSVGNCGQELLAARGLVPQSDGEVAGSSRVVVVQILQNKISSTTENKPTFMNTMVTLTPVWYPTGTPAGRPPHGAGDTSKQSLDATLFQSAEPRCSH